MIKLVPDPELYRILSLSVKPDLLRLIKDLLLALYLRDLIDQIWRNGISKMNMLPFPSLLSAQTLPPCLSAMDFTIARPNPVPRWSFEDCWAPR